MSVWIVGGTSGIGKAIHSKLLSENDSGFLFVTGEEVDVTDSSALENQLVHISDATTGEIEDPLRTVYFCAGINYLEWLGKMGERGRINAQEVIDVNLMGFINLMDVLVKASSEDLLTPPEWIRPRVDVVVITSDAAERPMRTSTAYCASKAGLNMAIRCAARELGPIGWRVFGIAPGMIEDTNNYPSKMTQYVDERVSEVRGWTREEAGAYEAQQSVIRNPLRIHPMDIANFAVSLADSDTEHLNGNIFTVNGGR